MKYWKKPFFKYSSLENQSKKLSPLNLINTLFHVMSSVLFPLKHPSKKKLSYSTYCFTFFIRTWFFFGQIPHIFLQVSVNPNDCCYNLKLQVAVEGLYILCCVQGRKKGFPINKHECVGKQKKLPWPEMSAYDFLRRGRFYF